MPHNVYAELSTNELTPNDVVLDAEADMPFCHRLQNNDALEIETLSAHAVISIWKSDLLLVAAVVDNRDPEDRAFVFFPSDVASPFITAWCEEQNETRLVTLTPYRFGAFIVHDTDTITIT